MMQFLKKVEETCEEQNVRLMLSPQEYVYTTTDAAMCRGFYDGDTLTVATGAPDWAGVLAHEYGHMEQDVEGLFDTSKLNHYDILEQWWQGKKKYTPGKISKAIKFVVACELDAERRAVGYISQYQLVTDLSAYIARANGYAVSYLWAEKHKRWPSVKVDWAALKLVPENRVWTKDEVTLTEAIEEAITAAQKKKT